MTLSALIIEDSGTQLRIVTDMINKQGWSVVQAQDLDMGLRNLQKSSVQLILSDVFIGDNYILHHLMDMRAMAPGVPIAVMTAGRVGAETPEETLSVARRCKVDYLLQKPFTAAHLTPILTEVKTRYEIKRQTVRVLVVDDSSTIRTIVRRSLEAENVKIHEAQSMEEALGRMDILTVDIVITDIFMPGMGGIKGISIIRNTWPDVAILAMTSGLEQQLDPKSVLRAAEKVGATKVLEKPFTAEGLRTAVFDLLSSSKTAAA